MQNRPYSVSALIREVFEEKLAGWRKELLAARNISQHGVLADE
jgi:hypothetical protein